MLRMNSRLALTLTAVSLVSMAVVACTSAPDEVSEQESLISAPDGAPDTTSINNCPLDPYTDWDTCLTCCEQLDPNFYKPSLEVFTDCVCHNPQAATACKSVCGDFCAGQERSAACTKCLRDDVTAEQCYELSDSVCRQDPTCLAIHNCRNRCPQPWVDGGGL